MRLGNSDTPDTHTRTSSYRPSLRLAAMLGALVVVAAAMTRLEQPETHRAIARVLGEPVTPVALEGELPAPLVVTDRFASVKDNAPFRGDEQPAWFEVLSAVQDTGAERLSAQSAGLVGYAALTTQPDVYRGRVVSVTGKVQRVDAVTPAENDAGVQSLWRVTLQPTGGEVWPITVYTLEEPRPVDEPYDASAVGVFFKKLSYRWAEGVGVTPVIVAERMETTLRAANVAEMTDAQRFAQSPPPAVGGGDRGGGEAGIRDAPSPNPSPFRGEGSNASSDGSLGRALLADLGVNLTALDMAQDKQRLLASEAEVFYALLDAVESTPASQLARLAHAGLPDYVARRRDAAGESVRDRQTVRVLEKDAERGRYSVVPLFGDGEAERGELVVYDATVRRAVRVEATGSAAAAEAGVTHYYELEAFPEDSQNLPLVFVVRELPPGFPVGDAIRQPARLAGFFFKQWAYRTRRQSETKPNEDRRQYAPLLIGRAPIPLAAPEPEGRPGLVIGVMATLGLAGVALALWRQARHDRQYETTTLARVRDFDQRDFDRLASIEASDSEPRP